MSLRLGGAGSTGFFLQDPQMGLEHTDDLGFYSSALCGWSHKLFPEV